jgi:hypothetical protein
MKSESFCGACQLKNQTLPSTFQVAASFLGIGRITTASDVRLIFIERKMSGVIDLSGTTLTESAFGAEIALSGFPRMSGWLNTNVKAP